jgi:hypothetical protein
MTTPASQPCPQFYEASGDLEGSSPPRSPPPPAAPASPPRQLNQSPGPKVSSEDERLGSEGLALISGVLGEAVARAYSAEAAGFLDAVGEFGEEGGPGADAAEWGRRWVDLSPAEWARRARAALRAGEARSVRAAEGEAGREAAAEGLAPLAPQAASALSARDRFLAALSKRGAVTELGAGAVGCLVRAEPGVLAAACRLLGIPAERLRATWEPLAWLGPGVAAAGEANLLRNQRLGSADFQHTHCLVALHVSGEAVFASEPQAEEAARSPILFGYLPASHSMPEPSEGELDRAEGVLPAGLKRARASVDSFALGAIARSGMPRDSPLWALWRERFAAEHGAPPPADAPLPSRPLAARTLAMWDSRLLHHPLLLATPEGTPQPVAAPAPEPAPLFFGKYLSFFDVDIDHHNLKRSAAKTHEYLVHMLSGAEPAAEAATAAPALAITSGPRGSTKISHSGLSTFGVPAALHPAIARANAALADPHAASFFTLPHALARALVLRLGETEELAHMAGGWEGGSMATLADNIRRLCLRLLGDLSRVRRAERLLQGVTVSPSPESVRVAREFAASLAAGPDAPGPSAEILLRTLLAQHLPQDLDDAATGNRAAAPRRKRARPAAAAPAAAQPRAPRPPSLAAAHKRFRKSVHAAQRAHEADARAQEAVRAAEKRVRDAEEKLDLAQGRAREAEEKARDAEHEMAEAEAALREMGGDPEQVVAPKGAGAGAAQAEAEERDEMDEEGTLEATLAAEAGVEG